MLSPENYIRKKARALPMYECLINANWKDTKIVQISVARKHTNENITAALYLIDLACLGVKDTFYIFNTPENEYRKKMDQWIDTNDTNKVDYILVHNIVYASIAFAEDFGFEPHKDFTLVTKFLLEEDNDDVDLLEIECGMDGKPAYFRGPFDDAIKANRIITRLEKNAGSGNYLFFDKTDT
ncbi:MAG: hypothetical protein CVV49_21760 [Spirochaetae bacterium HGW-Spirochaetae-5]|jgi:hypothetical protein|nr:MAG: hypothetical protein CVV49_21760 [Spirochaetae bacterium HGW-Spirochaetae-5]